MYRADVCLELSSTGELFAVKELPIERSGPRDQHEAVKELMREISLLESLEHPNIVRYVGTQRTADNLLLFTEYITGICYRDSISL